ncbi:hypothetical protein [Pandoraea communis]|uniref:hypothetical protein n=1 Tax=Pandoraea communis TaxID=2508297 RepID=UPI00123EF9D2|nr:hypothetical protein [Pandoraea communis]MDM8357946.1 hypothetical protein [Pandoraea communis]
MTKLTALPARSGGSAAHPPTAPALKPTETLLSMLYPRTLRNVGVALALATFAMFSASAFAASASHTQSRHHAKAQHASSSKHRRHGTATKASAKTSAHRKSHAHKTAHGKKKTMKAHHTLPPKTTHRTHPTVASHRHPHSRA